MTIIDLLKNDSLCKDIIDFYLRPESILATAKYFNIGYKLVRSLLKSKDILEHSKKEIADIKQKKFIATCNKKFGGSSPFASDEVVSKAKETNLQKYGVDYPMQNKEILEKMQSTFMSKYNVRSPAQIAEVKEKIKLNNLLKYDCENVMQNLKIKAKVANTNLQRYGNICSACNETVKAKAVKTLETHYGVDNPSKNKAILEKSYQTKKDNHTFSTSKPEENFYNSCCKLFGRENVFRQYNTEIYEKSGRYPFACDFYIKPLDLFVELNINWTHGQHPFDKTNKDDIDRLTFMTEKAKNSSFYKKAIEVWTIRDIQKFEAAKMHNLNYIALYNSSEINDFLNNYLKHILKTS